MKLRTIIGLLFWIFSSTYSFAQTDDDQIEFIRVKDQIKTGNYNKALEILTHISEQGKNSLFYLTYTSTCFENLKQYDKAASSYKQLYELTKSSEDMKKVAEMRDRQDALVNCPKCHGKGSYTEESSCSRCSGDGTIRSDCRDCKGDGKCTSCNGSGNQTIDLQNGRKKTYECPICNGTGKCTWCKGVGYSERNCGRCNGSGKEIRTITCNH